MKNRLTKLVILIFPSLLISCAVIKPFKKIKSLHVSGDFYKKESIGKIKEEQCQYAAGEYSVGEKPSFDKVYEDFLNKTDVAYYTEVRTEEDNFNVTSLKGKSLGGKECFIIMAEGHK